VTIACPFGFCRSKIRSGTLSAKADARTPRPNLRCSFLSDHPTSRRRRTFLLKRVRNPRPAVVCGKLRLVTPFIKGDKSTQNRPAVNVTAGRFTHAPTECVVWEFTIKGPFILPPDWAYLGRAIRHRNWEAVHLRLGIPSS